MLPSFLSTLLAPIWKTIFTLTLDMDVGRQNRKTIKKTLSFLTLIWLLVTISKEYNNMAPYNQLRVACWNARGYLSDIPYIRELLKEVDILAVSEHWLHANRLRILEGISPTHFVHAHASRDAADENYGCKRGQGGRDIFWRKNLSGISKVSEIIHDKFQSDKFHLCIYAIDRLH